MRAGRLFWHASLLLGVCTWLAAAQAAPVISQLHFSVPVPPSNSAHYLFLEKVLQELCLRLKFECRMQYFPPARGEQLLRRGDVDGEMGRGVVFAGLVPEAQRVPSPLVEVEFVILQRKDNARAAHAKSWADLRTLDVVYNRGYKFIEVHQEIRALHAVGSNEACFSMVAARRADVCLLPINLARQLMQEASYPAQDFRYYSLERGAQYLYLARHRAALVPSFDVELKKMQQDGSLAAIYRQYFAEQNK